MSFEVETAGRVSQGKYWAFFGANMILIPLLLIGGAVEIVRGSWGIGLLMIVAVVPLGISWREIMMRRCRDIGWPAFLPWLSFGMQFLVSFSATQSLGSLRHGGAPSVSTLSLPLFMALADFAFSIVIGCIGTKAGFDYTGMLGDGRDPFQQPRGRHSAQSVRLVQSSAQGLDPGGDDEDRYDAAIARALEAHRRGDSAVAPPQPRASAPSRPLPPGGGFGRRLV
jgi:uncharacterized membrane protein YhaH (DUF805 family)